ncbi:family 16 glycosylhydrolase [Micromonospora noduli]|uniref:Licheninase n=1 Tax=Micromonospora noduli TaxID=709876 RepID=A0A328N679_9ACTN|nr:glycoside hydrolase family 16 protein [Micromonospora noduli]KAB1928428.1 family 16 glycosylhydrolase [Micromonospora noduli]RAN99225.1 Licheninase [Micromonospora noduli]RAO12149.1 Licheninase [Micromonospora noduli]RAO33874.1 Licheninase [Micromonospora noduli]RAO36633.1 Licheninase [Micromonospora noduli]
MFTARPSLRFRPLVLLAAALVATATALVVPAHPDRAEAAIGPISWQDEFNSPAGTPVDQNKWRFDIGGGGWGNNERQYYTNSTSNAVHDGQGNLVITARRDNPANYQCHYGRCEYTSARLLTAATFTQTYGRFEARIKIPRGQGIWPAFWMLGTGGGWPDAGEIDVMENIGREPNTVYGTVHGPGYSGGGGITGSRTLGAPLADTFHTYRVDWEPNVITWYVDGVQYHRVDPARLGGNRWVFDHPFFMILNVAVGGNWPGYPDGSTQFPQQMLVDYVRVSSYTSGGGGDPTPGTNRIRGAQSGRCIDIPGANPVEGAKLQIWDCNTTAAQSWTFASDGTVRAMGKCMDPAWAGTANGTEVNLVSCNGNTAQRFTLNASGDLVNLNANKCVDVREANPNNGGKLHLWDCLGAANQKWSRI